MNAARAAGALLIAGSLIFGVGAAIGVPRVFTEPDPESRLRMLEERVRDWRMAQPLYGLGPLVASAGVGFLAADAPAGWGRTLFAASCATLVAGVVPWSRDLFLRSTRVREFAFGTLPGWPFRTYVLLTVAGLALLGAGLLTDGFPVWLGWLTVGADVVFLAAFLGFDDIPPFVFYVLLLVIGVAVL